MGVANTNWVLQSAYTVENHGQRGTFGCINRDAQPITVTFAGQSGSETIVLAAAGDAVTFALLGVDHVEITAPSYPATVALKITTSDIVLDAAPILGVVPTVPAASAIGFANDPLVTVVTVGATAVPLPATARAGRLAMLIQNPSDGAGTLWIGGAGVTADEATTGGFQLAVGDRLAVDQGAGLYYAISDGAGRVAVVTEYA
jgi:hypothetical protein